MKKIIMAMIAMLPLVGMAQSNWEIPTENTQQVQKKKKALIEKNPANEDPKYLVGAVPMENGKVVFTLDYDIEGMSAEHIYNNMYRALQAMTQEENQFKSSKIALVNKEEHIIAARFKEWLVFQNTLLSLDRTVFNYTIIATCTDGHVNVSLCRISYEYEKEREGTEGLETTAEEWITDEYALTKKKNRLAKYTGKFRRKTIDRKDEIFSTIIAALHH